MAYRKDAMTFEVVMEVFSGKVNSVSVCRDKSLNVDNYYFLHRIHDHDIARMLIQLFEENPRGKEEIRYMGGEADDFLLAFDYSRPRPILDFYMGSVRKITESEDILKGLIAECIATKLPFPILYLIITQKKINLAQDGSISFDLSIDFQNLDPGIVEKDCVRVLAELVRNLLAERSKKDSLSLQLVRSKLARGSYYVFRELYVDVSLAAQNKSKLKFSERWRRFWHLYGGVLFRLLVVLSVVAAVIALIFLISNLATSGIPLFRIFVNSFKKIGTLELSTVGLLR